MDQERVWLRMRGCCVQLQLAASVTQRSCGSSQPPPCHPTAPQAMGRLKELAQSGIHFCVGLDLEPYGEGLGGQAVSCVASAGGWVCALARGAASVCTHSEAIVAATPELLLCTPTLPPQARL